MGRHRTAEEKLELGERARAMRAAGRSRREIEQELGIGDDLAKELLRGVPVPESLRRPRAKDELRALAVKMRAAGRTYDQISAELGVSKSTCSLWLRSVTAPDAASASSQALGDPTPEPDPDERRVAACALRAEGLLLKEIGERLGVSSKTAYYWTWGMPLPPRARSGGDKAHMDMMRRRYWDKVLAERQDERELVKRARRPPSNSSPPGSSSSWPWSPTGARAARTSPTTGVSRSPSSTATLA